MSTPAHPNLRLSCASPPRAGRAFPALLASLALALGTAGGPAWAQPDAPAPDASAQDAKVPQPAPAAAAIPAAPPETGQDLDSDLVYAVLVAELAGRRGDLAMAFTHYLHAAQLASDPKMAELAVRAALAGEDDAGAERAMALWLKLAPESVGAHQLAALLRIRAGDREGALTALAQVVELSGRDGAAGYQQVIGIVGRAASNAERVALMRALVERDADDPEAQQALAMVAAAAEDHALAESAARRALELRPDWSQPRIFLVRLLLSQDKREEAGAALEEYVAARPEDRALRMLYGQFLVEEKDLARARHEFEHLLGNQPKEPDVLFAVGILSLQLEDDNAARDYFTRLYQTGERGDEAAYYLGQVEERAENWDAAVEWYGKAGGASEIDAQIRIALVRARQGDVQRAREIVQQLRDLSPDHTESLYLVEADILDEVGREDEASSVYDRAVQAFPDNADMRYARAMYAVGRDRLDRAEADLRHILERDPEHADALNALGYTLADRTDRHAEAKDLIERAYKLKPDEPAILDSMGWVNYRLGNLEVAREFLEKALERMDDGEIAAHLGEVLWAMGRQDEAWQVWDKALKSHPEHAYLLETLGRYRVTRSAPGDSGPSAGSSIEATP